LASENNSNGNSGRRWSWLVIGVIAAALLIPVFSGRKSVPVHTVNVERGAIRSLISTNGKIEPTQNFEAHSPISTTVKRLLVKEGDHVRKGQLLLELDDADIRSQAARAKAQVASAQASESELKTGGTHEEVLTLDAQLSKARTARNNAKKNADAMVRLQKEGAASAGEVEQAQANLRHAQADLTLLEQKQKERYSQPEVEKVHAEAAEAEAAYQAAEDSLAKSNVRAPFDGIVYSLPAKMGAFVQAGELLLQEADLSRVLVRVFVDEPDIGRLVVGQKTEVTWDAIPGRVWNGTVNTIPFTVKLSGARHVGEATCAVDNHDLQLLPNVNVNVSIVTAEQQDVLTLRRDALRIDDDKPYVFEVVDNHLRRRDVQISLRNLTLVEITSGLQQGATVALTAEDSKPLYDGAPVKVVP
jgi:HlyD family secretion protein